MSETQYPLDEPDESSASKDIAPVLNGWEYEPGSINVRKIRSTDGTVRVQMRLDLGLLQMEMSGRPDGQRPHGCESLLEYYEAELSAHTDRNGTELGFHLTSTQCQALREEAQMYYWRYLSLYVLEDYRGVVRDTSRNLKVLDLCGKYAVEEQDRLILEQYRPYIMMMNARASASILVKEKKYAEGLAIVDGALTEIRDFFTKFGQADAYGYSSEVKVLKKFAREIRKKLPIDPVAKLQAQLERAVKAEQYEEAAKLRDQIRVKSEQQRA